MTNAILIIFYLMHITVGMLLFSRVIEGQQVVHYHMFMFYPPPNIVSYGDNYSAANNQPFPIPLSKYVTMELLQSYLGCCQCKIPMMWTMHLNGELDVYFCHQK